VIVVDAPAPSTPKVPLVRDDHGAAPPVDDCSIRQSMDDPAGIGLPELVTIKVSLFVGAQEPVMLSTIGGFGGGGAQFTLLPMSGRAGLKLSGDVTVVPVVTSR
jgi:hypothetical protein